MKKLLASALALILATTPLVSLASYGSASSIGSSLSRDNCPNGDYSISYYDGTCDDDTTDSDNTSGVTLDGYIYFDDNSNGGFDSDESGVQGAIVTLKTVTNSIVDTDVTSAGGYYAFYNVGAGTYKVHVSVPARLTTLETLLAFFAPAVNAQSDYEFTVTVGADETGVKRVGTIPVVDGEIKTDTNDGNAVSSVNNADDMANMDNTADEDTSDDDISSILDLIKEEDDSDTMMPVITTTNNDNDNEEVVLPAFLPNTGASL